MSDADDLDLLRCFTAAADGAEDAFAEVVRRHAVPVREACRRRLRDPAAADDAAQAVFLILARKASDVVRSRWWSRPVVGDWLHRTAQHVCANHERQRLRRQRHEREAAMSMAAAAAPGADTAQLRERIDAALAALPARYRQPVVLHYLEGRERADVAAALGLSDEALKKRLQRALEALRHRLTAPEGAAPAIVAALAPLGDPGSAADLASAVAGYLRGAPVPAAVSIHVSGGLHAMRLAIAKTAIASCAALALAGGAFTVIHAETAGAAPVTVAQRPTPGAVIYWDSLLDWTFDLGGSNPGQPQQWQIPRRMFEYIVYRGEVRDGGIVAITPVIGWRVTDADPESIVTGASLQAPDGSTERFDERQSFTGTLTFDTLLAPHPEQFELTLADDRLLPARFVDPHVSEYGPLIGGLGVPDLLLPVPAATWKNGDAHPIAEGTVSFLALESPTFDYGLDRLELPEREVFTHTDQIFGQNVEIHVLVGAKGSGTARMRWNAGDGAPSAVDSAMKYQVQLRSRAAAGGEPTALLAGTLTMKRHSALLDPQLRGDATLQSVGVELRRERLQLWWDRLHQSGDQPLLRTLAFSVLLGFENLPRTVPGPAAPAPAPEKKDF